MHVRRYVLVAECTSFKVPREYVYKLVQNKQEKRPTRYHLENSGLYLGFGVKGSHPYQTTYQNLMYTEPVPDHKSENEESQHTAQEVRERTTELTEGTPEEGYP